MEKNDLVRIEQFMQRSTGYQITVFNTVDDDNAKTFVGQYAIPIRTPQGVAKMPFDFEIPVATISEAFDTFSECAMKRVEEMKREQLENQKQIVSGAGVDVNKIKFPGIVKP
jgi:hypothetical protein